VALPEIAVLGFFGVVLVVLAAVDLRTRRLPNRIVLPAAALVLAAQIAIEPSRALEWVLAALAAFGVLLGAHLANPRGLGMGDVKLALLLGAALGWAVAAALVIGFFTAALAGLALILYEGWTARKRMIPLGPFLALGGLAAVALSAIT
jgi:leader peptidase (prepilin peptidase)/N-methyltransferase